MTWPEVSQPGIPADIWKTPSGRLVLIGGGHNVMQMFRGTTPITEASIKAFASNCTARDAWCRKHCIGYRHWVFPDASLFVRDEFPDPEGYRSVFQTHFQDRSNLEVVRYPLDDLADFPERQMRTDTHYSQIGNTHLAALIAADLLGIDDFPYVQSQIALGRQEDCIGDLGIQCTPSVGELTIKLPLSKGLALVSNGLRAGNNGIIDLLTSPNAMTSRKLLLMGDSFYRSLAPFLARYYASIVFVRTPFFHEDLALAAAPDDILTGNAERYLRAVTQDAMAPHFLAFPLIAGVSQNPDPGFAAQFAVLIDQRILGQRAP